MPAVFFVEFPVYEVISDCYYATSWQVGGETYVLPSKDDGSGVPDILMIPLSSCDLNARTSSSSKLEGKRERESWKGKW